MNIKLVQQAILAMYAERGIHITPEDATTSMTVLDSSFLTLVSTCTLTRGVYANQFVQRELPKAMGKKVTVGGTECRVRVWIDK